MVNQYGFRDVSQQIGVVRYGAIDPPSYTFTLPTKRAQPPNQYSPHSQPSRGLAAVAPGASGV